MTQRGPRGKGDADSTNEVLQTRNGEEANARLRADFGATVRKQRLRLKLTQETLAARSELSVDAIRRLEAGRFSPTLETLRKLCSGLEISLPTLFQSLHGEGPEPVSELTDYLSRRSARELKLAWKVLRAMFDGN